MLDFRITSEYISGVPSLLFFANVTTCPRSRTRNRERHVRGPRYRKVAFLFFWSSVHTHHTQELATGSEQHTELPIQKVPKSLDGACFAVRACAS